jgi:hypothetical protein
MQFKKQQTSSLHKKWRFRVLGIALIFIFVSMLNTSLAQVSGEKDFNVTCVACHTIGQGRLIGPDLAGVTDRRSDEWLTSFIKSSQSVIKSGDGQAVILAKEYAGLVMPDTSLSDKQIKDIVNFLRFRDSATDATREEIVVEAVEEEPASEAEILSGQQYFQGERRLANGGAACNSCHDVRNDAVIGGGVLAVELTTAFSRMGRNGMRAILGQAPFPVMQVAYEDKALTEDEIISLVAFLEFADSEEYNQLPRDYGIGLFLTGTAGAGFLFAFFGVLWRGRKVKSVNQAIYDRQIKSQDLSG